MDSILKLPDSGKINIQQKEAVIKNQFDLMAEFK